MSDGASPEGDRVLATVLGGRVVRLGADAGGTAPRAYDDRGRAYAFEPPAEAAHQRFAIDVERKGAPPPALAAHLGGTDDGGAFFRRWTALEVRAKLDDVPILCLVKGHEAPPAGGRNHLVVNLETDELWIAVGTTLGNTSAGQAV